MKQCFKNISFKIRKISLGISFLGFYFCYSVQCSWNLSVETLQQIKSPLLYCDEGVFFQKLVLNDKK